jgi:hypothetical protein
MTRSPRYHLKFISGFDFPYHTGCINLIPKTKLREAFIKKFFGQKKKKKKKPTHFVFLVTILFYRKRHYCSIYTPNFTWRSCQCGGVRSGKCVSAITPVLSRPRPSSFMLLKPITHAPKTAKARASTAVCFSFPNF